MLEAALALPQGLSLVTLAERPPASWSRLFDSPAHIRCTARTPAERNLLGARIDQAVTEAQNPVLLVAEGAGCFAAAWWARLSPATYVSRVAGALLFQPVEQEDGSRRVERLLDTFASPRAALPFPSILLGPQTAQADLLPRVRALADAWGSRVVLDRASPAAAGPFERTRRVVERFTRIVVEREVATAERLVGHRLALVRPG